MRLCGPDANDHRRQRYDANSIAMRSTKPLQIASFLVFVLTAFAGEKRVLHIEIRSAKTVGYDADTYVAFATDETIELDTLSTAERREDNQYIVFRKTYGLLSADRRHATIVYVNRKPNNQPEEVFLLSIPHKPKPIDWTDWQHPDYVETNAVSNFRFSYTPPDRSTNVPPNSFELRYKIE